MIDLALYQPDIAPNVGSAMRLCACLSVPLHIIEPCGFIWDLQKMRRVGMDYIEAAAIHRHRSWSAFLDNHRTKQRIILLTTKTDIPYTDFQFLPGDILLAGRESAGVPEDVHIAADARITIPMAAGARSHNIINAAAMVLGEALRQTKGFSHEKANPAKTA